MMTPGELIDLYVAENTELKRHRDNARYTVHEQEQTVIQLERELDEARTLQKFETHLEYNAPLDSISLGFRHEISGEVFRHAHPNMILDMLVHGFRRETEKLMSSPEFLREVSGNGVRCW